MPMIGKTIAHHAITKAIGRDDTGELVDKSRNTDLATLALLFLSASN